MLLNTDEPELVWELVDPTVLGTSPMGESESSGRKNDVDVVEDF